MKLLFLLLISLSLFAREAILRDVLDEHTILVEYQGELKRAFLAGVASYLRSNPDNKKVDYQKREALRQKAMEYLKENLPVGEKLDLVKIDYEDDALHVFVIRKRDGAQLNYQLVKDGYALLDCNDPYLLSGLYGRMKIAMKYAQAKKRGLWRQNEAEMAGLIEKRTYYGSTNKKVKKEDVVEFLKHLSMAPAL